MSRNKCNWICPQRRLEVSVAPNCSGGKCAAQETQGGTDTQLLGSRGELFFSFHLPSTLWRLRARGSAAAPKVRSLPPSLAQPHFHRRAGESSIGFLPLWRLQLARCTQPASGFLEPADSNNPSFRTGDALRMDVVEKATVSEIAVVCGAERGVFELTKFGPGGASRCIRSANQSLVTASYLPMHCGEVVMG